MQLASWVSSTTGHPVKTGLPAKAKRVCNSCKMNVSEAVSAEDEHYVPAHVQDAVAAAKEDGL
jgi:hypothetical protein